MGGSAADDQGRIYACDQYGGLYKLKARHLEKPWSLANRKGARGHPGHQRDGVCYGALCGVNDERKIQVDFTASVTAMAIVSWIRSSFCRIQIERDHGVTRSCQPDGRYLFNHRQQCDDRARLQGGFALSSQVAKVWGTTRYSACLTDAP